MLSKGARVALLSAVSMTVCGSIRVAMAQESARASSAATASPYAPTATASLPVFYDRALAAQGFPNPLVKARIAGHEGIFIVDTGGANVLAKWYADAAGIPSVSTGSLANDMSGKTATERLAHRVQGHWSDGQRFTLNEAVVIAFPPYFKSLHLAGSVSPRLLAPAGTAAVLDLRAPSIHFMPFARALSDLRRSGARTVPPDLAEPCRNSDTELASRVYLAPVKSSGITELMQVDTGATGTSFSERSKIAKAIESRSQIGPLSEGVGGAVRGRIVRGVRLLLGGRTVVVNPSIEKISPPCQATGNLGMDALRSCTLILGDKEMALSCRAE